MGKKMQGSNSNVSVTKAGKKSGQWVAPPAPNPEKQALCRQGEQQFIRNKGRKIGSVVVPKDETQQVLDVLCRVFNVNRKPVKPFDTGYRYDETRKRVVVPENEFTNGF